MLVLAVDVHGVAVVARLDGVVPRELVPMFLLVGAETSRALAQRAGVLERRHHGLTDELALVGKPVDESGQGVIDLERNDLVLHGGEGNTRCYDGSSLLAFSRELEPVAGAGAAGGDLGLE